MPLLFPSPGAEFLPVYNLVGVSRNCRDTTYGMCILVVGGYSPHRFKGFPSLGFEWWVSFIQSLYMGGG